VFPIKKIGRLYLIQIWALLAIWLASYFDGLEVLLSILFVACIIGESIINQTATLASYLHTVLPWQLPGILLSIIIVTGLTLHLPGGEYYIFVLELWYTPLIPLISISSDPFLPQPLYYNLLLIAPLIMMACYVPGLAYNRKLNPARK
jgi:hypothetical protein